VIRLGITGTDTSVGKTVVAVALVGWLKANDVDVVAMKPIECGDDGDDAAFLHRASGFAGGMPDVCPIRFPDPIAPLAAATARNAVVDVSELDGAFSRLSRDRDAIVVEGAGGILVPITETLSYAQLFARWDLDTIIVAADRLGVINHVMLTVMAALEQRLSIKGVVLNTVVAVADDQDQSRSSNQAILQRLLPELPIIRFSHMADPRNLTLLIREAEDSGLGTLALGRRDQGVQLQTSTSVAQTS
jgi:dethiobiotin synthetase